MTERGSKLMERYIMADISNARVIFEARYGKVERTFVKKQNTIHRFEEVRWAGSIADIESRGGVGVYFDQSKMDAEQVFLYPREYRHSITVSDKDVFARFKHDVIDRNGTTAYIICSNHDVTIYDNTYGWTMENTIAELSSMFREYIESSSEFAEYVELMGKDDTVKIPGYDYSIAHIRTFKLKEWGDEDALAEWVL